MNSDQLKGKAKDIKGDLKQRVGGARKDAAQQGEGLVDQAVGKIQKGYGDLKEKLKKS